MPTALPAGWADQLLGSIGAPDTPTNVTLLEDWQTAEGGSTNNPDAFNPFNTTRNTDAAGNPLGGTPTNSVGVLSFPTWQAGEAATAATLEQNNMTGILADLQLGAPVATTEAAIAASPWGTTSFPGSPSPSSAGTAPPGTTRGAATTLAGFNANPFDLFGIPQTIGGSVASSIWSEVGPFIVKAILVLAGLGVIAMGLWKTTSSTREKAQGEAQKAAPLAELAAA